MKKILLTLLSMLPFRGIAIAAESARLHINGLEQQKILMENLRAARLEVLAPGSNSATFETAIQRLSEVYETDDRMFLEKKLSHNLNLLREYGILTVNEEEIMSASPSPDFQ